jgi:hypothetical protein
MLQGVSLKKKAPEGGSSLEDLSGTPAADPGGET